MDASPQIKGGITLNRIILIGRLTRDPELKYTSNGTAVAKFTLAVDRKFSKEKETDFIDVIVWRGLAENVANYLRKGRLAAAEGRLQIRTYEDKEGNKRKAVEVVADDVRFLDKAPENTAKAASGKAASAEPAEEDYEEIPF